MIANAEINISVKRPRYEVMFYRMLSQLKQTKMKDINYDKTKESMFEMFHRQNPKVYRLFKKFSLALIEAGHNKIGSKLIIERIRYESAVRTTGNDHKINNNFTAYYSRRFIREFPQHTDRFTFRKLISN